MVWSGSSGSISHISAVLAVLADLEYCGLFWAEWIKEEDSRMMIQTGIISDEPQFRDLQHNGA